MKPIDNQEKAIKCICVNCSLYGKCNHEKGETLFCARKKSECTMDNTKMCICGACPVYKENNLSGGYFCINEMQ